MRLEGVGGCGLSHRAGCSKQTLPGERGRGMRGWRGNVLQRHG